MPSPAHTSLKVLITAGPTHEPIDAVRFLGNRSSGRLGLALAAEAAQRGHQVTLLLGPVSPCTPVPTQVRLDRFRTTADLQALLARHWTAHDVLIMAAAVADYRPTFPNDGGKIRRSPAGLILQLEPTPDLLSELARRSRPDQTLIGFALEESIELPDAARAKLTGKGLDAIVANPLATMDADDIRAMLHVRGGETLDPGGAMPKDRFAAWLLDRVAEFHAAKTASMSRG